MPLRIDHLAKTYPGGVRALDGVSLEVAAGELLVLVGPSGSGKTTLLRLVAGLESPSAGCITLGGRPLDGLPPRRRDIAMVFQHGALYPHLSVRANLGFSLRLRRCGRAEIARRVGAAAALLGIEELLGRRPGQLSGGQRQRVALGRALVRQPRLFLFDEPLSHLEAELRGQLQAEIRRLHARLGATMIYVTHDQAEAMTLGQRIAVLHQGRLQQVADPLTLYRRPANRFVAGLLGTPPMNFIAGRLESRDGEMAFALAGAEGHPEGTRSHSCGVLPERSGQSPASPGWTLAIPQARRAGLLPYLSRQVILGLRPEHLAILPAETVAPGTAAGSPRLAGVVEALERLGPVAHVFLQVGGVAMAARAEGDCPLVPGQPVALSAALEQAHFFDPETGLAVGTD